MHKQAIRSVRTITAKQKPVRPGSAKSLPQKYFVSPEIFAAETKEIFAKQWLLVGHHSQIAKPGDKTAAAAGDAKQTVKHALLGLGVAILAPVLIQIIKTILGQ